MQPNAEDKMISDGETECFVYGKGQVASRKHQKWAAILIFQLYTGNTFMLAAGFIRPFNAVLLLSYIFDRFRFISALDPFTPNACCTCSVLFVPRRATQTNRSIIAQVTSSQTTRQHQAKSCPPTTPRKHHHQWKRGSTRPPYRPERQE